jgi:predicted house-cleaning noncanonical NTP pyrophosphatase (MazG superfamily)
MKKVKHFNKLIRDEIPLKIKNNGEVPVTKKLRSKEFKSALLKKLEEEALEFKLDPSLEEAADILEVLDALFAEHYLNKKDILKVKKEKRKERGGFLRKLFLIKSYKK